MATKTSQKWLALMLSVMLVACGGGSSSDESDPITPEPVPEPEHPVPQLQGVHFELHSGRTKADFSNCLASEADVPLAQLSYGHLMYGATPATAANNNAESSTTLRVLDTAARCTSLALVDADGTQTPLAVPHSRLLHLSAAKVNAAYVLTQNIWAAESLGWRASSFVYDDAGLAFTGYAGINAQYEQAFRLDAAAVQAISAQDDGWMAAAPALYHLPPAGWPVATDYLVAGARGRAPADAGALPVLADGSGLNAVLYAPHHLLHGADGKYYFIDGGQIRVAENTGAGAARHYASMSYALFAYDWAVTTLALPHAANALNMPFLALAADAQGNIHALEITTATAADFVWHRLAEGTQLPFNFGHQAAAFAATPHIAASFAIIDGDMLLALHPINGNTSLYRIAAATGKATKLTGDTPSDDARDFLAEPATYMLPPVQHVHYGVDGHLYLLLEQGILIARNFTWPQQAP